MQISKTVWEQLHLYPFPEFPSTVVPSTQILRAFVYVRSASVKLAVNWIEISSDFGYGEFPRFNKTGCLAETARNERWLLEK
jgi:hypothetical protein